MKTMIINLLKTPAGNYSRKSLMILVSFIITMLMAVMIVIGDMFLKYTAGDDSIGIFNSMLIFVTGLTAGAITDKKIASKPPETKTEE